MNSWYSRFLEFTTPSLFWVGNSSHWQGRGGILCALCGAVLFGLFSLSTALGQNFIHPPYEYPYRLYTLEDGLSQAQTRRAFQDSNGFIWVTTKEGVDRFDGLEFVNYRTDSTFIKDFVEHITEDSKGQIWFSGRQGAYRYDGTNFTTFSWDVQYTPPSIYIGQQGVRFKSLREDNTYYLIENDTLLKKPFFPELTKDKRFYQTGYQVQGEDILFVRSQKTEDENKRIELHAVQKGKVTLLARDTYIAFMPTFPENSESLRFQVGNSIYRFTDGHLTKVSNTNIPLGSPIFFIDDRLSFVKKPAIFTQNDVGNFLNIFETPYHFSLISNSSNGLLIGTEKGLARVFTDHALTYYPTSRGMMPTVWSMLEDDQGDMWFASFSNRSISQLRNHTFHPIDFGNNADYAFFPGAIKTNGGEMWFPATQGLFIIDKNGSHFKERHPLINYFFEDDRIYGAGKGLYIYEDHQIIRHYSDADGLDMTRLGYLETIGKDTTGLMWLGSHLGLATWDGQQFKNYYLGKEINSGIMAIKKDHRDNLWFGTHGGVAFYDYTTELPQMITPQSFNKDIRFIEFIDSSYVLMGGSGELYLLDLPAFYRGDFDLYTFTREDGFTGEQCLQNASYKDSKGHIWMGTTEGVVKLNPEKLKLYKEPTEPHFASVSYQEASTDKSVLHRVSFGQKGFSVSATSSDRNIEIKFYTINHHKPRSITYRHRLKGYEENWSLPRAPRFVSYSNLPPKKYEFELQACLGNKCSEVKSLYLDIRPSVWHEYRWVRGSLAGLLLLLVYAPYRQWRHRRQAQRHAEKLEKENIDLELKQLKMRKNLAVHKINPHFTFNVLNAISDLILRQETQKALIYTAKFGNLFRPLLANEGRLFRTLEEEIKFIKDYLKMERLRFPEKFDYKIQIDEGVEVKAFIPTMILHSFVNNAVKHGMEPLDEGGFITIEINQQKEMIRVMVTDNGIGRLESAKRSKKYQSGEGIRIALEIFHYLNEFFPESSINIEDGCSSNVQFPGTKVTLNIYAHYPKEF